MKLTLTKRFRAALTAFGKRITTTLEPVSSAWSSLARAMGDWTSGAWQQVRENPDADDVRHGLTVALVYSCVRRIATDIAKMSPGIRRLNKSTKVWERAEHQVFDRLIYRPNHFQTWFQFVLSWVTCKNIAGNTYVAKLYGASGLVQELIVLDPTKVTPLIAHDTGAVFYRISAEPLARVVEDVYLAAADIIHDRYLPLGHPLVGTSPLDRALSAASARGGIMDQAGDTATNSGVPPGILTTPEGLSDEQLKALADRWRQIPKGRIAVIDAAYKFEALASKYVDSQAVEIAELAGVDICAAFGVPPWKVGMGTTPAGANIEALQIIYYQDCLQWQVEEIEQCLDMGLGVAADLYIELDPCGLFKLDSKARAEVQKLLVGAGVMAPNEARQAWDLGPVKGGETPYLQQQNYSLAALSARDLAAPAPSTAASSSPGGGGEAAGPESDTGARLPASPVLPWAGVYDAAGEYPPGVFVTHKGSLWARVGTDTVIGFEPGGSAPVPAWKLAVKRGEVPQENV